VGTMAEIAKKAARLLRAVAGAVVALSLILAAGTFAAWHSGAFGARSVTEFILILVGIEERPKGA
jgi:hypothetical protein